MAVLAATAGGVFGGAAVHRADSAAGPARPSASGSLRATVVAGTMAIAATAWIGRDLSDLAAQPVVFGLAYLAFALAVAIRFGAIPLPRLGGAPDRRRARGDPAARHGLGAGRPRDRRPGLDRRLDRAAPRRSRRRRGSSSSASPSPRSCWRPLAAWIQDDLEHIVGYSIVGDAGVVLLAVAALDPAAWAPARMWILAFVVARSAFAAWAAADPRDVLHRPGRRPARLGDPLAGPGRRRSALVVLASIGLPGLAGFEARGELIDLALDGPLAIVVWLGAALRRSPTTGGCSSWAWPPGPARRPASATLATGGSPARR